MPKRRDSDPRYQMPFDFDAASKEVTGPYALSPAVLAAYFQLQEEAGRFVFPVQEGPKVTTTADAASFITQQIFSPFSAFDQEEFWVLLLNTKNVVTHTVMAYRGTVNTIYTRPAELFKPAIRYNTPGILLTHCHPSGDPTPSPEDISVTKKLVELGHELTIDVLDHLVVGNGTWTSLREKGMGF
jgi:DNA repair protein RadC